MLGEIILLKSYLFLAQTAFKVLNKMNIIVLTEHLQIIFKPKNFSWITSAGGFSIRGGRRAEKRFKNFIEVALVGETSRESDFAQR